MIKKMTDITIACIVCLIVVVTIAVPILGDAEKTINTIQQNTGEKFSLTEISEISADGLTYSFAVNGDASMITLNGVDILSTTTGERQNPLLVTDKICISEQGGKFYTSWDGGFIGNTSTATLEIDSGGNFTFNTNVGSGSGISFIFIIDDEGKYGVYNQTSNSSVGLNKGETAFIFAEGVANNNGTIGIVSNLSSYTDGVITEYYSSAQREATTIDDVTVSFNVVEDHVLSESLSFSALFDYTYDTEPPDTYNAPIGVIAPIEYKIITSQEGALITMINIIPLLLVVAILFGVVGAIFISSKGL